MNFSERCRNMYDALDFLAFILTETNIIYVYNNLSYARSQPTAY